MERRHLRALLHRVVLLSAACAFVLSATGCTPAPSGPAVETVERYVAALPVALHGDTLAGIAPFATDAQTDRVRLYVAYVLNEGQRMESSLVDFKVVSQESDPETVKLVCEEAWSVVYRDAKNANIVRAENYRLRVRYTVSRQEGSWQVSDVEELERTDQ